MTLTCPQTIARFGAYGTESLLPEERGAVREHLAGCRACRQEALAGDPTPLFAFAGGGPDEVSRQDVAQVLASVRTGIAWKEAERKLGASDDRPRGRAGVSAAAVAVAALTLSMLGSPTRLSPSLDSRLASSDATAAPAIAAKGELLPAEAATPERSGLAPASSEQPGRRPPADLTIYDRNPGAGEPRVFWILDRSLDI